MQTGSWSDTVHTATINSWIANIHVCSVPSRVFIINAFSSKLSAADVSKSVFSPLCFALWERNSHIVMLTGCLISLASTRSPPFQVQNCPTSLWHTFNKELKTFLQDFLPRWHNCADLSAAQPNANLPFRQIPKVLYWIEIKWLWRSFEYSKLTDMFQKPAWDDMNFVTWCVILLEAAIGKWRLRGHKDMDTVSNNTQVGCDA